MSGLPRHIQWRRQYDQRRYARHLTQLELNRRIRDILLNMLRLTPEALTGLVPLDEKSAIWIEKFTHMLEELQLRYGPHPAGLLPGFLKNPDPFPDFASELAEKAAKTLSSLGLRQGEVFIKFGKRIRMEPLFDKGALRLQPASYFADKAHVGAVRDDEVSLSISLALSRDDVVRVVKNPQDVPIDAPEQRVDVRIEFPTDYWLYCMTTSVEPRLFVDFQADACVIIHDKAKFAEMLQQSSERQLPGVTMHQGPAVYIDPILPTSAQVFVPFAKPFGYAYQEEHRFCWLPKIATNRVEHIDIEIGSLKEIADLIVL